MDHNEQVRVIEVVEFNPDWKKEYERESEKIRALLKEEVMAVHHIGSTSIPGICAKPTIDMLVEVRDINEIDRYNEEMKMLGYLPKGENGIEGRRFFVKGLYNRTHHVHIFEAGNPEIKRHLNFRDYMAAHPEEAKGYEKLKRELAEKFRYDADGYSLGKDEYIKSIDIKAGKWAEKG